MVSSAKYIYTFFLLIVCPIYRNYMNDGLRTDIFMRYRAETIACACIFLAARTVEHPVALPMQPHLGLSCSIRQRKMCAQSHRYSSICTQCQRFALHIVSILLQHNCALLGSKFFTSRRICFKAVQRQIQQVRTRRLRSTRITKICTCLA